MCNVYSDGVVFDRNDEYTTSEYNGLIYRAVKEGEGITDYILNSGRSNRMTLSEESDLMRRSGVRKKIQVKENSDSKGGVITLYDEEGKPLDENGLLEKVNSNKMYLLLFTINEELSDSDFIGEFKEWLITSKKIYKYSNGNDDWAVDNLPLKDFVLKYETGGNTFAVNLKGCMFHDEVNGVDGIDGNLFLMLVPYYG